MCVLENPFLEAVTNQISHQQTLQHQLEIGPGIFNMIQSFVKVERHKRGVSVINDSSLVVNYESMGTVEDNTKENVGGKKNTFFSLNHRKATAFV